jgi:Plasmid replication region DNA-binding N-term
VTIAESNLSTSDGQAHDFGEIAPVSPRAPRISQSDVFQAADALLLEGHKPTIDRVRMRLGRGSPNTIQEHLDVSWAHLGSRLRDVPGREFPALPERVGRALQALWNTALDSAHEVLGETVSTRERSIVEREGAFDAREKKLLEQEREATARGAALEESLGLARDQLLAANQRADHLEISLHGREAECTRLCKRIDSLETDAADLRSKFDATVSAHQAETS